jgi:hypothetical protein
VKIKMDMADMQKRYNTDSKVDGSGYKALETRTESDSYAKDRVGTNQSRFKKSNISLGEEMRQYASLERMLAEKAMQHGKLNLKYKNVIGKDAFYTAGDVKNIVVSYMPLVGNIAGKGFGKKAREDIALDAIARKGDSIEILSDNIGEIVGEQYQIIQRQKIIAQNKLIEIVQRRKELDHDLFKKLIKGKTTTVDGTEVKNELLQIAKDLKDVDDKQTEYESLMSEALDKGDVEKVKQYSNEVEDLFKMKHAILDKQIVTQTLESDVRMERVDAAETVQSIKGAMAAAYANYQTYTTLLESLKHQEIKYRNAKDYLIPALKDGAVASTLAKTMEQRRELLYTIADATQSLIETNARSSQKLHKLAVEMTENPLMDAESLMKIAEQAKAQRDVVNEGVEEWAKNQLNLAKLQSAIEDDKKNAGYATVK